MSPPHLLFLPGLLEDADVFTPLIESLQRRAPCGVADLTRSSTIAALARDALAQAPAGPLAFVAHSMGGYVALEAVRQAPERVAGLALLNTNAQPDPAESTEMRRRLLALAERDFPGVIAAMLPRLLAPASLGDAVLTGTVDAMALAVGREAFARQQAAIIGRIDSRPHLAAIRCPTVVVAGAEDAIMPVAMVRELADGIPGARFVLVEGAGHLSTLEQPTAVRAAVHEWRERLAA